jgi:alkylation response protein AidB-like acyl-CoA dehydrogenase
MTIEELPSALSRDDLALATYGDRGTYVRGRRAELDTLRAMGRRNPSLGRLYEGHFNGALLVALYGSPLQRFRARADVERGELFGVWNTQGDDPVTIERRGPHYALHGAKTWASGADRVTRALITARTANGDVQMCLVPLDRVRRDVDPSAWRPLGMRDSNSYRIAFDGIELDRDDLIGAPGDYERPPWFLGGAIRFAAVHAGILERLVGETIGYVIDRGRATDPLVRARVAEMRIAANACCAWLRLAEDAWCAFDRDACEANARAAADASDMARTAIERACLDALEASIRTVGAHGMVEPLPFADLFRDLHMYLRQPAPDAALLRVADAAIAEASIARNVASAESTGSSGSRSNAGDSAAKRSALAPNGALASMNSHTVARSMP